MAEFFLNPLNLALGAALISAPIIIHLINRMRFKRIRWAAMEFLLRSQKRNRRRLIMEQLLLLALRCLLVALTGLLLARFLGFSWAGFQAKNSTHVVILDDRLSTSDRWRNEDGEVRDCFQAGKQLLEKELTRVVAQARTPQRLVFFRLSEPGSIFDRRLNEDSLKEFSRELASLQKPTVLHLDMARGVDSARVVFDKDPQDYHVLHLVSDFRQTHWSEPEAAELLKGLEALGRAGVKINLIDTAHPARGESQRVPLYHDNLAVVELRPETRIAAEGMPVQFHVTVANFSPSTRKNVRVSVKVNGVERLEASVPLQSLVPGQTSGAFQVAFNQLGFNAISANLEDEEVGLQADNTRFATIEVRRQVPVLIIDGDPTTGERPGGDTYHVRTLLTSARGFDVTRGNLADLERPNLGQYPNIYLLNVREFNDRALKNLEEYVRDGGSVAFFLGDRVNPEYYTRKLYAGGKGLFPAPLADRPSPAFTEEERQQRQQQSLLDPHDQAFVRNPDHPVFAVFQGKVREFLKFLNIDRHWPVPRQKWDPEPGRVEELMTLPNARPITDYQAAAQELLDRLPAGDPQYAPFRPSLERHRRVIRDTLTAKSLYPLATALDDLLNDEGDPAEPSRPKMKDFWAQTNPQLQALQKQAEQLRDRVRYGDPLVIAGRYGRGRTVAFLTTAGKKWNDWAGGGAASVTFPVMMLDLQRYLTGLDAEENRTAGTPIRIELDGSRYEPKLRCALQSSGRENDKPAAGAAGADKPAGMQDLGELLATVSGHRLTFFFDRTETPGVYHFDLMQRSEGGEPRPEKRAYVVNVDTANESDLRRAPRDELERVGRLQTPGLGTMADLVPRQSDLSESAWFYLLFLVVLVVEQALAVHLSFHLPGNEALAPPQALRPQPTAA